MKFKIKLYDRDGYEIFPNFLFPELPYPEMRIYHNGKDWRVIKVRVNIPAKHSAAEINKDPFVVDVIVEEAGRFCDSP